MILKEYFFVCALPIFIFIYRRQSEKGRASLLFLINLLFYGYYGLPSLIFVVTISVVTFGAGKLLEQTDERRRREVFTFFSVLLLIAFFYGKTIRGIFLLGISYYLLTALGYLTEIFRGKRAEKNLFRHFLVLSFFPISLQGPVCEYEDLLKNITKTKATQNREERREAVARILGGYFKKVVIADRLAPFTLLIFEGGGERGLPVLVGIFLYSLRLLMDFTGGIDIVIGISKLMGIGLPENFKKPLLSKSLQEYWGRWHISLSSWFSRYVFYPVSVKVASFPKVRNAGKRWKKRIPIYTASLLTWCLTGLWHGFAPGFLAWGLSNAVILLISYEFRPRIKKMREHFPLLETRTYGIFMAVRTFAIVTLLRLFDRYEHPLDAVKSLFGAYRLSDLPPLFQKAGISPFYGIILSVGIGFVLRFEVSPSEKRILPTGLGEFLLFLLILLFGVYGKEFSAGEFIYGSFR